MDLTAFVDPNRSSSIFRNYYLTDGYAYTEDHIKVHKLFVYQIPLKTTVDDVRDYFEKYGIIKNVCFVTGKNRNFTNAAFIHFESPTAVARVLDSYHQFHVGSNKVLYRVQVCDSWHQPNCQPTKELLLSKKIGEDQFVLPNRDGIFVLNDDCLKIIIRLLPISSQLRFARSCSRICQVFQMASKSLYRTLFLERLVNMTQWEIRDFFDFVGDCIIRIEGNLPETHHQRILKSMSIFCINIEELHLESHLVNNSKTDRIVQFFRKLSKLKTLKLSKYIQLPGRYLNILSPTIESISVCCVNIEDRHIISLCKSLNNLKELNLGILAHLSLDVANALAVSCPNLETLTLEIDHSDYGLFAKLQKLKNLTVFLTVIFSPYNPILTQLVKDKSHRLEILVLHGIIVGDNVAEQISRLNALRILDCPNNSGLTDKGLKYFCDLEHLEDISLRHCHYISNAELINLLLKCKKLKRVFLKGCYHISNNLIFELIQKMQEQIKNKTFLRTEPLLLIARSTAIGMDILNNAEYIESSHLVIVEIIFD